MDDADWIAPAEAERLVASRNELSGLIYGGAIRQIYTWIEQDQIRVKALEVTRWQDEPPAPPRPSTAKNCIADESEGIPLSRDRVRPIGAPRLASDMPLAKAIVTDYVITTLDWSDAAAAGADVTTMWTMSEFTHRLLRQQHPNARITYAGIRMAKADIERRMAIAGWGDPKNDNAEPLVAIAQPPTGNSGRRRADWWPDFAEELAVYMHEMGVPEGYGQQGQSAMIDEIFRRLNTRGKNEPGRTSVQPVVHAVLARLRQGGN